MLAFVTGGSGVDVLQLLVLQVILHMDNVRMAANQHVRSRRMEQLSDARRVASGATGNVSHQHIDATAIEPQILGVRIANRTVVNVSINSPERLEVSQLLRNFQVPKISSVPDLVAVLKRVKHFGVKKAVCVGDDSNLH